MIAIALIVAVASVLAGVLVFVLSAPARRRAAQVPYVPPAAPPPPRIAPIPTYTASPSPLPSATAPSRRDTFDLSDVARPAPVPFQFDDLPAGGGAPGDPPFAPAFAARAPLAESAPPAPAVPRRMTIRDLPAIEGGDGLRAARRGPSIADLRERLAARAQPDVLQVQYQLGLALTSQGLFVEAHKAFADVSRASPGFRDAASRASRLGSWIETVRDRVQPTLGAPAGLFAGRFTLLGEIGRGAMAVVFRARDEKLQRDVALKFMNDEAVDDPLLVSLFQREARSAGSVNHPNVVLVYDTGVVDGRPFLCMELVEGASIDAVLGQDLRMPVGEALRVGEQVLLALEYMHERRLIHRDVKPSNLLRTADGVVKLADFGLAKSADAGHRKATAYAGSPAYMSPEQCLGQPLDGRSDLFSVGASLYEMISGVCLFAHDHGRDQPPPPLRGKIEGVTDAVDDLLRRALAFDPRARFATATEMLAALRAALAPPAKLAPPAAGARTRLGTADTVLLDAAAIERAKIDHAARAGTDVPDEDRAARSQFVNTIHIDAAPLDDARREYAARNPPPRDPSARRKT